jgi:hypothetical protein
MEAEVDWSQVATLLRRVEPGKLPETIFDAVAGITVTPVLEVVPLKLEGNLVHVLLTRRPPGDVIWPSMRHTPGVVIRAFDNSIESAIARLMDQELDAAEIERGPTFVEARLHRSRRGVELALVHWIELSKDPGCGELFVHDKLPGDVIESQLSFIATAVQHFNQAR